MLTRFAERLKARALSKFIAMLPRFSLGQLLTLARALQSETDRRYAERVIDDYLADPEEVGVAGSEIARNAELCHENERASAWCENQGLAHGSHERRVPPEEVLATISAGAAPGRLAASTQSCNPHAGEAPLMAPGEFARLKNISHEESRRRVPVAPPIPFRSATDMRDEGFEYNFGINETPPPTQAPLSKIVRDAVNKRD